MQSTQKIAPCLWFDSQAEEAANFYVSVFKNSKITSVAKYTKAGQETHKKRPGSVMTVEFELDGQPFTALNGGPDFKFNEAVSLQVPCRNQDEIDHYWNKLSKGGDPKAQQCGWLKDKYGLSWQVVPSHPAGAAEGHRVADGGARDGGDASDEEDRHRRAGTRRRWRSSYEVVSIDGGHENTKTRKGLFFFRDFVPFVATSVFRLHTYRFPDLSGALRTTIAAERTAGDPRVHAQLRSGRHLHACG